MKFAAVIALTVAFAACKKDDKDDTIVTTGLLYLLDQTSGNCASITKTNATQYTVNLSSIPKGGCNQATILGSDLTSRKAILSAQYDGAIAIANSIGCSAAAITTLTNAKNTAINAITQTTFDTSVSTSRYTPIGDLRTEMMPLFTSGNPAYTESEVMGLNRLTVDQTITAQYVLIAINTAGLEASCLTAFNSKRTTDFKGFFQVDPNANSKATVTGIGFGFCSYGTAVPANQKCASLNEQF